ncbi:SAM-dependent methyltransferase [Kitasatospora terrestris]|uniref:SAM-dependent methyltransferase n=1 Tax=Kitasatospora terrestris TaxID=258051 RepID=A0ABP9E1J8_9ACTN
MASAQMTGDTAQRPGVQALAGSQGRARDWAEIQERMLVPLYQAVYQRLEVGAATSLLALGCRSGLALLLAAERGAQVTGEEDVAELRELAQGRGLAVSPGPAASVPGLEPAAAGFEPSASGPGPSRAAGPAARFAPSALDSPARFSPSALDSAARFSPSPAGVAARSAYGVARPAHSLVTVFEQLPLAERPTELVAAAARRTLPGGQVVLASWGPPERCESASVLAVAHRHAPRPPARGPFGLSAPGAMERLLNGAGLRPAGSGRVSCPFAYADLDEAVRGMLSTGLFERAVADAGEALVAKELEEALHPYVQADGSVRMVNLFRYVVAER